MFLYATSGQPLPARLASIALGGACSLLATALGLDHAPAARGPIWPHVLAALAGFASMLLTLGVALTWIRKRQPPRPSPSRSP